MRYPCGQCEYAATRLAQLTKHKQKKHEGIRYPCDHCKYVASDLSCLKQHKQTKHECVIYPCDQCEFAATTLFNLRTHKQSKHEGLRYPCDQCEHSALYKSDLNRHKRRRKHTGPVECGLTDKKIKLTTENIEPKPVHVKFEPEPDDYDNTIKFKVLEEDPLAGF